MCVVTALVSMNKEHKNKGGPQPALYAPLRDPLSTAWKQLVSKGFSSDFVAVHVDTYIFFKVLLLPFVEKREKFNFHRLHGVNQRTLGASARWHRWIYLVGTAQGKTTFVLFLVLLQHCCPNGSIMHFACCETGLMLWLPLILCGVAYSWPDEGVFQDFTVQPWNWPYA